MNTGAGAEQMPEHSLNVGTPLGRTGHSMDIVTFYLGDVLFGIDILAVQEIVRQLEVTKAYGSPEFVYGVLNLRGQIMTIIDIGKKLGLDERESKQGGRIIIVNSSNEPIGLLVDGIGDALHVEPGGIKPPPANLGGVQAVYFCGVVSTEEHLIGVLNLEPVLK